MGASLVKVMAPMAKLLWSPETAEEGGRRTVKADGLEKTFKGLLSTGNHPDLSSFLFRLSSGDIC